MLISDFLARLCFICRSLSFFLSLLNQTVLKVNRPLWVVFIIPPPLMTVTQMHVQTDKHLEGRVTTPIANKGLLQIKSNCKYRLNVHRTSVTCLKQTLSFSFCLSISTLWPLASWMTAKDKTQHSMGSFLLYVHRIILINAWSTSVPITLYNYMDHHQASNHPLNIQESLKNACSYVKFLNSGVEYHQVSLVHTLTNVLM